MSRVCGSAETEASDQSLFTKDLPNGVLILTDEEKFSWAQFHFIFENAFQIWLSVELKTTPSAFVYKIRFAFRKIACWGA